jgi:hypothetical protein
MINLIKNMENKLYDNVKNLTSHLNKIEYINKDLMKLEKGQNKLIESLKKINLKQCKITKYLLEKHNNNYLKKDEISKEDEKERGKKEPEKEKKKIDLFALSIMNSSLKHLTKKEKTLLDCHRINPKKIFGSKKVLDSPTIFLKKTPKLKSKLRLKLDNSAFKSLHEFEKKELIRLQFNNIALNKIFQNYKFDFIKTIQIKKANSFKEKKNKHLKNIIHLNNDIISERVRKKDIKH